MEINGNGKVKLEHRVTTLEVDNIYTKETIKFIRKQVSNDIPHQIKIVDNKVDSLAEAFNNFKIKNEKWLNRVLVAIILMLLGTIINFIK